MSSVEKYLSGPLPEFFEFFDVELNEFFVYFGY